MPRNITFQEGSIDNMYSSLIDKLIITYQEPIEGIKVWIFLAYPCNILDIQVNSAITLPRRNYYSFPFPLLLPLPPKWITFSIVISQKILLNIKDVEFDFRMSCILVLFPYLRIINVQFINLDFFLQN